MSYSACVPFTKHCERIQKFREAGDLKKISKNELDKTFFSHDAAYSDCKDLATRTIWDKIWKGKAYTIAINSKYDGYQKGLASMVLNFFDKKTELGVEASVNKELVQELHKRVLKNSKEGESTRDL